MGRPATSLTESLQVELKKHLFAGMPVDQAAELLHLPRNTVRNFATRQCLPLNRPVIPGSPREARICRAYLAGHAKPDISRFFRIAPCVVQEVLNRVADTTAPRSD